MPLPLAPLFPLVLRLGAVAVAGYAMKRSLTARLHPGHTDQRAEDALDDLDEGLAVHAPADRSKADEGARQSNAAFRLRRVIRWGDRAVELDASLLGRLKIRKV